MTARNYLVRGLIAGVIAGIAAFLVAFTVGEPHVQKAIELEETAAAPHDHASEHAEAAGHEHAEEESGHTHGTEVSRSTQRTWGLFTGTFAVGVALGGLAGLGAAFAHGRLGRLSPAQSTATVAGIGFVAFALVPFLKYPATPPAVGNAETIGDRTGLYFLYLLLSLVAAVAAVVLAQRIWQAKGGYVATVGGASIYLVVVAAAAAVLPSVNEVGDFPADTLWFFRISSLLTLAALWAVLGAVLTGLVLRQQQQDAADRARREFAASL